MSRHRNVRRMNYSEEYENYYDNHESSFEDDYCTSPSTAQFMYDRNKVSVLSVNEEGATSTVKKTELSDIEHAKLMSQVDSIRNLVGKETISDEDLMKKLRDSKFDTEYVLNEILNNAVKVGEPSLADTNQSSTMSTGKVCKIPTQNLNVPRTFSKPLTGKTERNGRLSPKVESPRSRSPAFDRNSPTVCQEEKNTVSSKSNTPRCQSPNPVCAMRSAKSAEEALTLYKQKHEKEKEQIHLVVVGHVDAGKSTLLGRLLCDLGQVSSRVMHKYEQESKKIGKQSFMYAWVLDETNEERQRGITMDIGHSKFETNTKSVKLLDAPGHKDFIPNMITGATQADAALLVVDSSLGEFETGFDNGGQTKEHAVLLRSLGVTQLAVIINKLDTVDWSKERYNEIVEKMNLFLKQVGFRAEIPFVPCSGLTGENVVFKAKAEGLSNWYNGPTVIDVIDKFKCPDRLLDKPFRFSVNDIFKGMSSGICVSGRVETGMVSTGDKVLVLPCNETVVVRTIQIDDVTTSNAFSGDHATLNLLNIDQQVIGIGDVLCSLQNPARVTTRFEAHIVTFNTIMPLTPGLPVMLHQQSLVEPAVVRKLISQLNKNTGEVIKKKPRFLPKNSSAIVEIETQRSICVELYSDIKQLGRIMLRVKGVTVAAGLITKIKKHCQNPQ